GSWACRRWPDTFGRRRQVTLRVCDELVAAGLAAKPVRLAGVGRTAAARLPRNDTHSADGILHGPISQPRAPSPPPLMMALLIRYLRSAAERRGRNERPEFRKNPETPSCLLSKPAIKHEHSEK